MKSFKNFIVSEEVDLTANVERGVMDVHDHAVRNNINSFLDGELTCNVVTPYVALNKVSKVLANFHIHLPKAPYMEDDQGVHVFRIHQFGKVAGMRNDGTVVTKIENPYSLYFEWKRNERGMYDVFAEIVTDEELADLIKAVEEDVTSDDLYEETINEEGIPRSPRHLTQQLDKMYGSGKGTYIDPDKNTITHLTIHTGSMRGHDGEAYETREHELIGDGPWKHRKLGKLIKHQKPPKGFKIDEETEEKEIKKAYKAAAKNPNDDKVGKHLKAAAKIVKKKLSKGEKIDEEQLDEVTEKRKALLSRYKLKATKQLDHDYEHTTGSGGRNTEKLEKRIEKRERGLDLLSKKKLDETSGYKLFQSDPQGAPGGSKQIDVTKGKNYSKEYSVIQGPTSRSSYENEKVDKTIPFPSGRKININTYKSTDQTKLDDNPDASYRNKGELTKSSTYDRPAGAKSPGEGNYEFSTRHKETSQSDISHTDKPKEQPKTPKYIPDVTPISEETLTEYMSPLPSLTAQSLYRQTRLLSEKKVVEKDDVDDSELGDIHPSQLAFLKGIGRTESGYRRKEAYSDYLNKPTNNANVRKYGSKGADYGYYQTNQLDVEDAVKAGVDPEVAKHLHGGGKGGASTYSQQTRAMHNYLQKRYGKEYESLKSGDPNAFETARSKMQNKWFGLKDNPGSARSEFAKGYKDSDTYKNWKPPSEQPKPTITSTEPKTEPKQGLPNKPSGPTSRPSRPDIQTPASKPEVPKQGLPGTPSGPAAQKPQTAPKPSMELPTVNVPAAKSTPQSQKIQSPTPVFGKTAPEKMDPNELTLNKLKGLMEKAELKKKSLALKTSNARVLQKELSSAKTEITELKRKLKKCDLDEGHTQSILTHFSSRLYSQRHPELKSDPRQLSLNIKSNKVRGDTQQHYDSSNFITGKREEQPKTKG